VGCTLSYEGENCVTDQQNFAGWGDRQVPKPSKAQQQTGLRLTTRYSTVDTKPQKTPHFDHRRNKMFCKNVKQNDVWYKSIYIYKTLVGPTC